MYMWKDLSEQARQKWVETVLERLNDIWGVKKLSLATTDDGELVFDIAPSTYSSWKTLGRVKMPWAEVLETARLKGVSLDYIFNGKETERANTGTSYTDEQIADAILVLSDLGLIEESNTRIAFNILMKELKTKQIDTALKVS